MLDDDSDAGESVLRTMREIVEIQGAGIRRRLAADLAQFPVDDRAFDLAVEAFDIEYRCCWDPKWGDGDSHCDAQMAGLAAALKTYLTEAGRS